MDILKLIVIFSVIIYFMKYKKPLYIPISAGIGAAIILYKISPVIGFRLIIKGASDLQTIYLLLAFYTITFLQRMMEKRNHLILAENSLSNLFNSHRINAMVAPFVIGLLPSPSAVLIAAPMVDNAGGSHISIEEKTFVTSYYRHISEAFLPTYPSIILALGLTGISSTKFILAMLPLTISLFVLGYFFYVKRIPKTIRTHDSDNKLEDIKNLIISLWPISVIIIILLIADIDVYIVVIPVIILSLILNKFDLGEIKPMFKTAFDQRLIFTTIAIMAFKEVITYTGLIERLPTYFAELPIPPVAIFALIFFFGTIVAGSQAIVALTLPLAFASIPGGGLALMVLLMSITYIASQISPTHICLAIVTEAFEVSFIDLVKKTIPVLISFIIITIIYSYALSLIL